MKISEQDIIEQYNKGERSFEGLSLYDRFYNFKNVILAGASFSKSFIDGDFSGADLRGANFSSSNVKTCDFVGADLRGANFANAALDAADFTGAKLDETNFEGATIHSYIFKKEEQPEH